MEYIFARNGWEMMHDPFQIKGLDGEQTMEKKLSDHMEWKLKLADVLQCEAEYGKEELRIEVCFAF
jgi:hypothetical protein